MRVLIIGSGAAGGFIGARLIERRCDVTFLVRPERKLQLVTRGVQLRSQFGRFGRPVHAITAEEIAGAFDVVVVATRAHHYEQALLLAAAAVGANTILMPVIEGARHLTCIPGDDGPRIIGAVMESRIMLDADGILVQRPPAAELHIGALRAEDAPLASELCEMFVGRGLEVIESKRIRAKAWERFAFAAAAVGTSYLRCRPLRDAMRFAHGPGTLQDMLKEAHWIGVAAGFAPDRGLGRTYERSFSLTGRPVDPPATIDAGGAAGDEAMYLLAEMVGIARRVGARCHLLGKCWDEISRPPEITLPADDMTVAQA